MDQYTIWIGNIHCAHTSDGQGDPDELYMIVKYDGNEIARWPSSGQYSIDAGQTVFTGLSVDLPDSGPPTKPITIELWDYDRISPNDCIGSETLTMGVDDLGMFKNLMDFRQDDGIYNLDMMVYGPGTVVIAPTDLSFSSAPANGLVFQASLVGNGGSLNQYPMVILSDVGKLTYTAPNLHVPIARNAKVVRFECRDNTTTTPWANVEVNTLANLKDGLPPSATTAQGEGADDDPGANDFLLTWDYLYPQGARVRREVNKLTDEERDRWVAAVLSLKNNAPKLSPNNQDKTYDDYIELHKFYGQFSSNGPGLLAHGNATFLTWHRAYCWRFEQTLRRHDPSIALPYWDWTAPGADLTGRALTSMVGGWPTAPIAPPEQTGAVATGPFATNWEVEFAPEWEPALHKKKLMRGRNGSLPTLAQIRSILSETTFDSAPYMNSTPPLTGFRQRFEFGPHGRAHVFVGGQLSDVPLAPSDPLFWLHHCHVDRVFETWIAMQKRRQQPTYAPVSGGPAGTNLNDPISMIGFGKMPTHGQVLEIGASNRMDYVYDALFPTKGPIVEETAEAALTPTEPARPVEYDVIGAPALSSSTTIRFTDAILPNPYTQPMRIVELTVLPVDFDPDSHSFELRTYAPAGDGKVTVASRVPIVFDDKQHRRQFIPIEPALQLPAGYSIGLSCTGNPISVPSIEGSGQAVYLAPVASGDGTYTLGTATQVLTNGWNVTCLPQSP